MADDPQKEALIFLRDIRATLDEQGVQLKEIKATLATHGSKLDKLHVDFRGLRGQVRQTEHTVDAISNVLTENGLTDPKPKD